MQKLNYYLRKNELFVLSMWKLTLGYGDLVAKTTSKENFEMMWMVQQLDKCHNYSKLHQQWFRFRLRL
jgi:hypothetical protein